MSNDIQEYFNNLEDDHKNDFSVGIDGGWLSGELTNLSEFTNLMSLTINNVLITNTNLDFLNTLPNKEKLKSIEFSGNQIKEVDFADLFTKFPNLEKINLQNNPVSAKNLDKLGGKFLRLVEGIEEQRISIDPLNSSRKTISKDLLDYAQKLIARNENTQYSYRLQKFILEKEEKQLNNGGSDKIPLLISGLIVIGVFVLVISCWLRQKRKKTFYE